MCKPICERCGWPDAIYSVWESDPPEDVCRECFEAFLHQSGLHIVPIEPEWTELLGPEITEVIVADCDMPVKPYGGRY